MRLDPDTVMLFCAGRGTRMKALTQTTAKPMIEVGGIPLVDHALAQCDAAHRKLANTHYQPDALENHLATRNVACVRETELLETGGGLKNALPQLDRDVVFTLNTDAVWLGPRAADVLAAHWNPDQMDALLLTVPLKNCHGHLGGGDFTVAEDGRLQRGGTAVYSGMQIIKTEAVRAIDAEVFSMNVVWDVLHKKGRLFGATYPGEWCDVGYPEGIGIAEARMAAVSDGSA